MCVCVYACVCMHVCVYASVFIGVYARVCMYLGAYVCVFTSIPVYVYVCACTCLGNTLLGQFFRLQLFDSCDCPAQLAPPNCGLGFVHVRDLTCAPLPQLFEHVFHEPYWVHPP